jgi:hypothetical protein
MVVSNPSQLLVGDHGKSLSNGPIEQTELFHTAILLKAMAELESTPISTKAKTKQIVPTALQKEGTAESRGPIMRGFRDRITTGFSLHPMSTKEETRLSRVRPRPVDGARIRTSLPFITV